MLSQQRKVILQEMTTRHCSVKEFLCSLQTKHKLCQARCCVPQPFVLGVYFQLAPVSQKPPPGPFVKFVDTSLPSEDWLFREWSAGTY